MPISPPVVYASKSTGADAQVAQVPSAGFIRICQSGNAVDRLAELKANPNIRYVTQISGGPILPSESRDIVVELPSDSQGLHIEAMYGKTKDTCAVGSIDRHSFVALTQRVLNSVNQLDQVVVTGAFNEAHFKATALQNYPCANAENAVSCLREISTPNLGEKRIRYANSYLPSVLNFLEEKYGATEAQSLVIPTSGSIRLNLQLPH